VFKNRYEVVYEDKYYLGEVIKNITIEDSLDEIALRCVIDIEYTQDYPPIKLGGWLRISGTPYGVDELKGLVYHGVVWEIESNWRENKDISIVIYDKCIYLKSEEEFLFENNTTATHRLKEYLKVLNLPIYKIPETGVKLEKAIYRAQSIAEMIKNDLKETARKSGKMYRVMMRAQGVELREIGDNDKVWEFLTEENIMEITQKRTLENAITKVKVLYSPYSETTKSKVLFEKSGDLSLGLIQKIVQDENITKKEQAENVANSLLAGKEEIFSFSTIDINEIRAGDKIKLNGMDLIVCSVRHNLGEIGRMDITAGSKNYVWRTYYK